MFTRLNCYLHRKLEMGLINYISKPIAYHQNMDAYYGPYRSIRSALSKVKNRYLGLTVGIYTFDGRALETDPSTDLVPTGITEYWFNSWNENNEITDSNFVEKYPLLSCLPTGFKIVTFDANGGNGVMHSIITDGDGNYEDTANSFTNTTNFTQWVDVSDNEIITKYAGWGDNPQVVLYEITVNAAEGGVAYGGETVRPGTNVTLQAVPSEGYSFIGWDDDNVENPRTVVAVANKTYTAMFEKINYTVTIHKTEGSNGVITINGSQMTNSVISVPYGSTITLSAVPGTNEQFNGWSNGITDSEITITVTENVSLSANFAPIEQCTITVVSDQPDYYSVGIDGTSATTKTVDKGTVVTIQANLLNQQYKLYQWSDGVTDSVRTITVNENCTLTANIVQSWKYKFSWECINCTVSVKGSADVEQNNNEFVDSGTNYWALLTPTAGYQLDTVDNLPSTTKIERWSETAKRCRIYPIPVSNADLHLIFRCTEINGSQGGSDSGTDDSTEGVTTYTLTINVPHSTVTINGIERNSAELISGEQYSYMITMDEGYMITSMTKNGTLLSSTGILYSATGGMGRNITIQATVAMRPLDDVDYVINFQTGYQTDLPSENWDTYIEGVVDRTYIKKNSNHDRIEPIVNVLTKYETALPLYLQYISSASTDTITIEKSLGFTATAITQENWPAGYAQGYRVRYQSYLNFWTENVQPNTIIIKMK